MDALVASLEDIKFDIETALEEQHGALPLPFPGMDKSIAGVCTFYARGACTKGALCPMRHVRGDRNIVCKHWLRGLCKKGDQCEFLHEYDMTKMPECYFYARFNACHNKECPFLHIDPDSKIKDCPWYDRGFCRHGPLCRHHHVRRVLCTNYVAGFCPDGSTCKYMHPRFELPASDVGQKDTKKLIVICHFCGDTKHKAMYCDKVSNDVKDQMNAEEIAKLHQLNQSMDGVNNVQKLTLKPLESVTCYKCGTKGHYANKCPKGHLAFLALNQQRESGLDADSINTRDNMG
ncbi:hypothetical protein V9T40_011098 [Parthenolecanium corni]|uniref:Cleavage and polyadenylation specificity factor subunit 4 n=1 Tax=Parthenolecanium corni TaxID=536013 RepID=A0AAN9TI10_9HEMI